MPMAMGAALKLRQVVANLERILAIEFLCAAQGIDYLRPLKAGITVEAAYQYIRNRISHVSVDRALSRDIDQMIRIMNEPEFIRFARTPHELPTDTGAPRDRNFVQGMAAGSSHADADEQPR